MAKRASKKKAKKSASGSAVTIDLPSRPLAYADAKFVIHTKGKKLGELRISKGGVDWYPRNAQTPTVFNWKQFADRMEQAE